MYQYETLQKVDVIERTHCLCIMDESACMSFIVILVVKNSWEGYKIRCPMMSQDTKDLNISWPQRVKKIEFF